MMRALVTGAAGFIGSHLSERLLDDGHDVIAVDRFAEYYDPTLKRENIEALRTRERFSLMEEDVASSTVLQLVPDVDVIFHLAGQPGVRSSWGEFSLYLRENVEIVHAVLEAMVPLDHSPRLVVASSSSIYGDAEHYPVSESTVPHPISPYGVSKLSMEQLVDAYVSTQDLPVVLLRYFTVYGPRQRPDMAFNRFLRAALDGEPIAIYGDGEQIRDFTFVDDVVDATIRAGTRDLPRGIRMNVCGGEPTTINHVLDIVRSLVGRDLDVSFVAAALGDVRRTGGTSARARELLDWVPRTSLEDGLRAEFDWYVTHRNANGA